MATLKLVLLAAALLVLTAEASADDLTFIHQGTGSGTLDGAAFPISDFIITAIGDTDDRQSHSSGWFIDHISASIWIDGLGELDIFTPTRHFVNHDGPLVGFSRAGNSLDLFNGPTDPAFGAWDMLDPIGPISREGRLIQWRDDPQIDTSGGILIFNNDVGRATFTAIPEPTTLALLAIGGMVAIGRRRR